MIVVPGYGRLPNQVLICGEAPGHDEAYPPPGVDPQPFIGKSGAEQEWYLSRHSLSARHWYRTNIVKEYRDGNPDPTVDQIAYWTPHLYCEIEQCSPRLIVAVGRFAARWFLGDTCELEMSHGIPHHAGAFDPSRVDRAPANCAVIPVYHPAFGLRDKKGEARGLIAWDYSQVASTLSSIRSGIKIHTRHDEYDGRECYLDVSGEDLEYLLSTARGVIAIDTEGTLSNPWSVQVSIAEGTGYTLRTSRPDFDVGISHIRDAIHKRHLTILIHNLMYDYPMCKLMGLDLYSCSARDSMYAAYLLRYEPQKLKMLAYRWCGMRMIEYEEIVGDVGIAKQIDYLEKALATPWPRLEPRLEEDNSGDLKLKKPKQISIRISNILKDIRSGKVNKKGETTDPHRRWDDVGDEIKDIVESSLGPMPIGTLADIPLDRAVWYASRDPDATLRIDRPLNRELNRMGLSDLMRQGMEILPIISEMQSNGMPASRDHFSSLYYDMTTSMRRIGSRISRLYCGGKPFNPASSPQTRELMEERGLEGQELTKGGDVSTSKKSIEHLRESDEAVDAIFEWREHQHIRDSFCKPVLKSIPKTFDGSSYPVRCQLATTRTTTRRLASKHPNLLAQPVRSELGLRVRAGFIAEDGELFGGCDLSQIEARVLAHESRDPLLCKFFHDSRDIHKETAALIFRVPVDQVTKNQRTVTKTINYGMIYGIQGPGLRAQLRMQGITDKSVADCDRLKSSVLDVWPGVREYMLRVERETRKTGMVRDCWGMIRYLPGIWSKDIRVAVEAARIAVSHRIQGGAQGMIQRSMAYLGPIIRGMQRDGLNIKWRLQIHDEIILTFDEDLEEYVRGIVLDAMINHCGIELSVPVEADWHSAKSWAECK